MKFSIVTLFPEMLEMASLHGVLGGARRDLKLQLQLVNPRQFTENIHHTVDDRPFGGSDGMIMMAEPLARSVELARATNPKPAPVIYLSPKGPRLDHNGVKRLAALPGLILICGRYGGVDQRFISTHVDEELSIGDYVLSGGEPAAIVLMDAVARQLEGVLGHEKSALNDTFANGLLEEPQFTRPRDWRGLTVPSVLTEGHHARTQKWQRLLSILLTAQLRPDLLSQATTSSERLEAQKLLQNMPESEQKVCGVRDVGRLLHSLAEV